MTPVSFDMSSAQLKPRPQFTTYTVTFNGLDLDGEEFTSWIEAAERIVELHKATGSAVACFRVEERRQ